MTFRLTSSAFAQNGKIPDDYARDGDNVSPPLAWSGVPRGTRSLVLIVEDPDAPVGTVTHWAACDIDPAAMRLPRGAGKIRQGRNDMGHALYDGPKPPEGDGPHRYRFRLSALDVESLDLPDWPSHREIKAAARAHAIGETELVGTFETPARARIPRSAERDRRHDTAPQIR
jgi:Raf kinase inhibitor-like YbhB/YbcL family protein